MAFHFDPSEYDGGGGGTWLDNGEHDVTVTNHELGEANTGTEYLQLTFEDGGGRTHEERFYLSDTVLWRLAMVFKAVGFTSKIDLHGNGMIRKALYGKPLRITIAPNTNPKTGKTYKQIKYANPPRAGGGAGNKQEPPPPREEPPSSVDDDIPF